ncbi:MAG: imidazole glycerol phosphate synthase subunit HisF [Candidatus Thermoplasmatota archaeon]
MIKKRIIACLDIQAGRVVKGTRFADLRDAGDPVELARRYQEQGADEVVFLDIGATPEGRPTTFALLERAARELHVPLTLGGGLRSLDDVAAALRAGADKVALNTITLERPQLVAEAAKRFGRQCVVVALDARRTPSGWELLTHGGRKGTGVDAIQHATEMARLGAGELLATSVDRDGTRSGYDLELLAALSGIGVPVVASGGAGRWEHVRDALAVADAALLAGILHSGATTIPIMRSHLLEAGVAVRP